MKNLELVTSYLRLATLTVVFDSLRDSTFKCEAVIERMPNDFSCVGFYSIKMTNGVKMSGTIGQKELLDKLELGEYRLSDDSQYNLAIFAAEKNLDANLKEAKSLRGSDYDKSASKALADWTLECNAAIGVVAINETIASTASKEARGDHSYESQLIKRYNELHGQLAGLSVVLRPLSIREVKVGDVIMGAGVNGGEVTKVNKVNVVTVNGTVRWLSEGDMYIKRGNEVFMQNESSLKRALELIDKVGLGSTVPPLPPVADKHWVIKGLAKALIKFTGVNGKKPTYDQFIAKMSILLLERKITPEIIYEMTGVETDKAMDIAYEMVWGETECYPLLQVGGLCKIDHICLADVASGGTVQAVKHLNKNNRLEVFKDDVQVTLIKRIDVIDVVCGNGIIIESISMELLVDRLEDGKYKFLNTDLERKHRLQLSARMGERVMNGDFVFLYAKDGLKLKIERCNNDLNHAFLVNGEVVSQVEVVENVISGVWVFTMPDYDLVLKEDLSKDDLMVGDEIHLLFNYSGVIVKINPKNVVIKSQYHGGNKVAVEWAGGYMRRGLLVYFSSRIDYEKALKGRCIVSGKATY